MEDLTRAYRVPLIRISAVPSSGRSNPCVHIFAVAKLIKIDSGYIQFELAMDIDASIISSCIDRDSPFAIA